MVRSARQAGHRSASALKATPRNVPRCLPARLFDVRVRPAAADDLAAVVALDRAPGPLLSAMTYVVMPLVTKALRVGSIRSGGTRRSPHCFAVLTDGRGHRLS